MEKPMLVHESQALKHLVPEEEEEEEEEEVAILSCQSMLFP